MTRKDENKILNSIRKEFKKETGEGYMECFGFPRYSSTYGEWLEGKYIRMVEDYMKTIEVLELDLREK